MQGFSGYSHTCRDSLHQLPGSLPGACQARADPATFQPDQGATPEVHPPGACQLRHHGVPHRVWRAPQAGLLLQRAHHEHCRSERHVQQRIKWGQSTV